jgi:formate-dependent nitrite reductase membrane component NrfD
MTSSPRPRNTAALLRLSQIPPQEGGTTLTPPDVMASENMSALPGTTEVPPRKKKQAETPKSYYDVPMLKPPVWKWEIATYFFLGGLSAGAYCIARMASRFGGKRYQDITEAGTLIAAAAFAPCPPLLIRDLGDMKRFHYMLRVFKPNSPMNLGSWTLSGYGAFVTLAALNEWRKGRNAPPAALETGRHGGKIDGETGRSKLNQNASVSGKRMQNKQAEDRDGALENPVLNGVINAALDGGGVPLALLLAGYTGVLLSTSSTPLWARKNWLGALFSASAISTGASAIELALQMKSPNAEDRPSHAPLKTIETAAKMAEAVTLAGYLTEAGKLAAPITKGKYAPHLWGGAVGAGIFGSALLGAIPVKNPQTRRVLRITGAVAGMAGGLALRWAISQGGHVSGKDPQAARDASRSKP